MFIFKLVRSKCSLSRGVKSCKYKFFADWFKSDIKINQIYLRTEHLNLILGSFDIHFFTILSCRKNLPEVEKLEVLYMQR